MNDELWIMDSFNLYIYFSYDAEKKQDRSSGTRIGGIFRKIHLVVDSPDLKVYVEENCRVY